MASSSPTATPMQQMTAKTIATSCPIEVTLRPTRKSTVVVSTTSSRAHTTPVRINHLRLPATCRPPSAIDPTAPTAALSVGVAIPAKVEPSTARSSTRGATSACRTRQNKAMPASPPSSSRGTAGADSGHHQARKSCQSMYSRTSTRLGNQRTCHQVADRHRIDRELAKGALRLNTGIRDLVTEHDQHDRGGYDLAERAGRGDQTAGVRRIVAAPQHYRAARSSP